MIHKIIYGTDPKQFETKLAIWKVDHPKLKVIGYSVSNGCHYAMIEYANE